MPLYISPDDLLLSYARYDVMPGYICRMSSMCVCGIQGYFLQHFMEVWAILNSIDLNLSPSFLTAEHSLGI